MAKISSSRDPREFSSYLKSVKGDSLPFRQIFDQLAAVLPMSEGMIVTSLPRGSLQVAQPQRLPESLLKAYAKEFHAFDRPAWQAITRQRTLRGRDCWPASEFEQSRYYREFLQPQGFSFIAVAPLTSPVLEGYPGALQIYRSAELGTFSDEDLARLHAIAADLDSAIARSRVSRRMSCPAFQEMDLPIREFIFDQNLNLVLPSSSSDARVQERLQQHMIEYARFRLGHVNGKPTESDRVSLPDSHGDLWHFRVVVHRSYPALGEGPFVFFCLQPPCNDWSSLRPTDFQADAEVARLVPAMKFMRENFHRGPTLGEIAKTVHLSPFHFHRRFTELFGITPKHFMLDCQIEQAKSELLAREKDLASIATTCGFAHQSHFTSRFKQATGLTPTRWRRMATEAKKVSRN